MAARSKIGTAQSGTGAKAASDKARSLLESTVALLRKELSGDDKDPFTRSYLEKRLTDLAACLDPGGVIDQACLLSAKNIVSNLNDAVDQNAAYNDKAAQFYKAVVGDLKDELEAACEDN